MSADLKPLSSALIPSHRFCVHNEANCTYRWESARCICTSKGLPQNDVKHISKGASFHSAHFIQRQQKDNNTRSRLYRVREEACWEEWLCAVSECNQVQKWEVASYNNANKFISIPSNLETSRVKRSPNIYTSRLSCCKELSGCSLKSLKLIQNAAAEYWWGLTRFSLIKSWI